MKWKDPPRAQDQQINPCRLSAGNIILQVFNQKQDFAIDEQNKNVKRRTLTLAEPPVPFVQDMKWQKVAARWLITHQRKSPNRWFPKLQKKLNVINPATR